MDKYPKPKMAMWLKWHYEFLADWFGEWVAGKIWNWADNRVDRWHRLNGRE